MSRRITVVVAPEMPYPRDEALNVIWQIENIERTEVKADGVDVSPISPRSGRPTRSTGASPASVGTGSSPTT